MYLKKREKTNKSTSWIERFNMLSIFTRKCKIIMMLFLLRTFKNLLIFITLSVGVIIIGVLYYIQFQLPDIDELNTVQHRFLCKFILTMGS